MESDGVADPKTKLSEYPPMLPNSKVRSYVTISDPELVDSFLDPVRRAILVALRKGIDSLRKEKREEVVQREDGTKVTTTILEEKKVKRFWMTVPEIVQENLGEVELSTYNCYYHLPKLIEQGLVEEFIPEGKESTTKRGIYYRRTAKVFVVSSTKMSGNLVQQYMTLFEKGFDVRMDTEFRNRLEDLLIKHVQMVDEAIEYLAVHLKEVDMDSTVLNELLTEVSFIFLSDNEAFLAIQKELKQLVLTPCCGPSADMTGVCSYCGDALSQNQMYISMIDGKSYTFCDERCSTSFLTECTQKSA
ncbi:MAG: hypothetical protein ACFFED_00560 [Candidatus Thorarchaeota archaeon]